jgi:hypothetical protein
VLFAGLPRAIPVTPFGNDAILSPSLARCIDDGEHCLKQSVCGDAEPDERDACQQGFDSHRISVSEDENSYADRDDCAGNRDEE